MAVDDVNKRHSWCMGLYVLIARQYVRRASSAGSPACECCTGLWPESPLGARACEIGSREACRLPEPDCQCNRHGSLDTSVKLERRFG